MNNQLANVAPQFFQTMEEIKEWLDKMEIKNYTVNPNTLVVDVDGSVYLDNKNLDYLPVQFGKIKGNFYCSYNNLTSLKGCPEYVKNSFRCNDNQLTTLKYCPKYIGNDFYCNKNPLKSLDELANCEIKNCFSYTYNENLSPIFDYKEEEKRYKNEIYIFFEKFKELIIIEQEKKLLNKNITNYHPSTGKIKI